MADKVVPARPWQIPEKVWVEGTGADLTLCWQRYDADRYKSPNDIDSPDYVPLKPGEHRTWHRPVTRTKLEHHLDVLNDTLQLARSFENEGGYRINFPSSALVEVARAFAAKWGPPSMCGVHPEHRGQSSAFRPGCSPASRDGEGDRVFYEPLSWVMTTALLTDAIVAAGNSLKRGEVPPLDVIAALSSQHEAQFHKTRADVSMLIMGRLNMMLAGSTSVQVWAGASGFDLAVGPTGFTGGLALALAAHLTVGELGLICRECGALFTGRSNRRYCDSCASSGAKSRQNKRRYDQRRRANPPPTPRVP